MTRRSVWCEWAWLGGPQPVASVRIDISHGRFADVTPGAPAGGAERREGLTLPGFANGHSHAFHRALRGRTHGGEGDFWTWRQQMYRLAARLDPDAYFRLARATYSEMVLAGFTTVAEFHYLHHGPAGRGYDDPNVMGRMLASAARDAGIRLTLLDTCYLHGGVGVPLDAVQRRFGDGTVDGWMERVSALDPGPGTVLGAAIHSVRACTPTEMTAVAEWAADRPLHAHVSEQPSENLDSMTAYGATPIGVLAETGVLGPNFTAVHATHLTSGDRSLLAASGCTVCACPSTERDLGDGVGDMRALVDAGVGLSLGTDSNSVIDGFEETRSIELHQRLTGLRRGLFSTGELLAALTNHAALGWPDAGAIATGNRADMVTVDTRTVRLAGTSARSMLDEVLYAASAADIGTVTVDGVDRVRSGAYTAGDVAAEFAALLPKLSR